MIVAYPESKEDEIDRFITYRSPLRARGEDTNTIRLEMGPDTNIPNLYTSIRTTIEQGRAEEDNLRTNYSALNRSITGRIINRNNISSNEIEDQRRIFEQIRNITTQRAQNVRKLAKDYVNSDGFVASIGKLQTDINQFSQWISSNSNEILSIESLDNKINELFGTRSHDLVSTTKFQNDLVNLTNTIIAFQYQNIDITIEEEIVKAFRIFSLIKRISEKDVGLTKDVIGKAVKVAILIPNDLFYHPDLVPNPPLKKILATDPKYQVIKKNLELKQLNLAYDEFQSLRNKDIVIGTPELGQGASAAAGGASASAAAGGASASAAAGGAGVPMGSVRFILARNTAMALRQETKDIIAGAGYNLEDVPVASMTEYIESQIDSVNQMMMMNGDSEPIQMNNIVMADDEIYEVDASSVRPWSPMGPSGFAESDIPVPPSGTGFKFLIGDLHVIKERISKYVPYEIGHIQNVLSGEHMERIHRKLNRTEETVVTEEEVQEETVNEFTTADKFQMQKAITQNTQETMSITAGVDVTVRYGKAVEANTTFDLGYEKILNESKSASSNHGRETIQKAIQRINKKTREQRTLKIINEMEETNKHGIDGSNQNTRGIYQYLMKHYCARLINYGMRLIVEFMVPEPLKLIRYIKTKKPIDIGIDEPVDPRFRKNDPIKSPADITFTNYLKLAADYGVEVRPYPKLYTFISKHFMQDGGDGKEHDFFHSADIALTPGYQATHVICSILHQDMPSELYDELDLGPDVPSEDLESVHANMPEDDQRFVKGVRIRIAPFVEFSSIRADRPFGSTTHWAKGIDWVYNSIVADPKYLPTDVLPVSISGRMVKGYSAYLYIVQKRTEFATINWKIDVFNKIMEGYSEMKSKYDQLLSEARYERQKTEVVFGGNPERNKRIIENELEKYAIMLLTERHLICNDTVCDLARPLSSVFDPPDNLPKLDFTLAKQQGQQVKFFHHALEMNNKTYLFYPYFWGDSKEWVDTSVLEDADPLFEKALSAGWCRLHIPVRPNFEAPFIYFLATGRMPNLGGDVYYPSDPLYVSIITEIKEQQDIIDRELNIIDEWEYRLSTPLVYLKETGDLPEFEPCLQEDNEEPVGPGG